MKRRKSGGGGVLEQFRRQSTSYLTYIYACIHTDVYLSYPTYMYTYSYLSYPILSYLHTVSGALPADHRAMLNKKHTIVKLPPAMLAQVSSPPSKQYGGGGGAGGGAGVSKQVGRWGKIEGFHRMTMTLMMIV